MSKFKIYNGTDWVDPCNCNVHIRKTDNTWQLLDPKNCPTHYWTGTEWCPIDCEDCACPDGYTYNPALNLCEQLTIIPAQASGGTTYKIIEGNRNTAYSTYGARLYQDISSFNFPINGYDDSTAGYVFKDNAGTGAFVSVTNSVASASNIFVSGSSTANGRLNRAGLWGALPSATYPYTGAEVFPDGQWLSVRFCVNLTETKTYIFALAGDNQVRAKIESDTYNPDLQPGAGPWTTSLVNIFCSNSPTGSSPDGGITEPFRIWHMFPITLPAGSHIFILEGYNISSSYAFGAELYDITTTELVSWMTSSTPTVVPGSNPPTTLPKKDNILAFEETILFSTKSLVTVPPLIIPGPEQTITWSCPPGYTFSECYGAPACVLVNTAPCGGGANCLNFLQGGDCGAVPSNITFSSSVCSTLFPGSSGCTELVAYIPINLTPSQTGFKLDFSPAGVNDGLDVLDVCNQKVLGGIGMVGASTTPSGRVNPGTYNYTKKVFYNFATSQFEVLTYPDFSITFSYPSQCINDWGFATGANGQTTGYENLFSQGVPVPTVDQMYLTRRLSSAGTDLCTDPQQQWSPILFYFNRPPAPPGGYPPVETFLIRVLSNPTNAGTVYQISNFTCLTAPLKP